MTATSERTTEEIETDRFDWIQMALNGRTAWLHIGLTVTLIYVAWAGLTLRQTSAYDFIHLGRSLVQKSHASPVISGAAGQFHYDGEIGYDGEFVFFIALDPTRARYYVDDPPYRYTRILYPLVAGIVGLHKPGLVADALIAINLLMILVGVSVLGAWLRRKGVSPWVAAVYGFYPGVFITLQRDTTEIVAYSLAIVAVYIYDLEFKWRLPTSAALFSLAALTRETTLVFAAVWALGVLLGGEGTLSARIGRNWLSGAVFLLIAFAPLLVWKAFLYLWLGSLGSSGGTSIVPFSGVIYYLRHLVEFEQLRTVIVPAFLCLAAALLALYAGIRRIEVWALLANGVLYMAFLGAPSFEDLSSSARVTVPIALAAVLALPHLPQRTRAWFWASSALWLAPMVYWLLLPVQSGLRSLLLRRL